MMWENGFGMGWGFGGMHLLWWVLLVVVAWALIRLMRGNGQGGSDTRDRAETLLRERYARGEIDKAEFEERLGELRK